MFNTNGGIIHYALGLWINQIKFDDPVPKHNAVPKALTEDQMRHILKLEALRKKAFGDKPINPKEIATLE